MLQTQSSRELNLWQTCHEIAEKSSKIVPLGAPLLFQGKQVKSKETKNPPLQKPQGLVG
jgi:hypothetical protein